MNHWLRITSEGKLINSQPCIIVYWGREIKILRPNSIIVAGTVIFYENGSTFFDGWTFSIPYGAKCAVEFRE